MSQQPIHLVHLYPQELNIYGDTGNRIVLQKRLERRGIGVKTTLVLAGHDLPKDSDIILGGGGQDAVQSAIQQDLLSKADQLQALAGDGVAMLLVCGSYQLFGRRFTTAGGEEIKGIAVLPLETIAGPKRLIGNIVVQSPWGQLVGYENHSGLTQLDKSAQPLGRVSKGAGNNGRDGGEGCVLNNIFGTYMHGPVLSKNPHLADEIIRRALKRQKGGADLEPLDDQLELQAAAIAKKRPR